MHLSLLFTFALCFNDELHVIACEVMFRNTGDSGTNVVKNAMKLVDESDEHARASELAAFLSRAERPPYNIDSFDHWRYRQNPLTYSAIAVDSPHTNEDDLVTTLNMVSGNLGNAELKKEWSYNFAVKIFLGLVVDSFNPLHLSELFDDDSFRNGDDSGRKFFVLHNGKNISLNEFWNTGCGKYTYSLPFTSEQWDEIDQKVTTLMQKHIISKFKGLKKPIEYTQEESYNISRDFVYNGIEQNKELPSDYVNKCIDIVEERITNSGYYIASKITKFASLEQPIKVGKQPMKTTEALAWSLFCLILPTTVFLVFDCINSKSSYLDL